jgi:hypothetical protein
MNHLPNRDNGRQIIEDIYTSYKRLRDAAHNFSERPDLDSDVISILEDVASHLENIDVSWELISDAELLSSYAASEADETRKLCL